MYKHNDIISGRYQIIKEIGSGGMSEVYLAYDKVLEIEIAIKVLFKTEQQHISRFRREAEIIESLDHDNIVKIHDFNITDDNKHYIVMEYVKGITIKEYIKKYGKFSIAETTDISRKVLDALGYAHSEGVIHRDIKSHNIMITPDKKVKIMDFGIAKLINGDDNNLTNDGSILGTTYYIAPEFLTKGEPKAGSDLYSLGIVMYEMLIGTVPYKGATFEIICMKHLKSELPDMLAINPEIPQPLENAIIRATAKKVDNRFATASLMEKDLTTCLNPNRADEPKLILEDDIQDNFEKTAIYDTSKIYNVNDLEKDLDIKKKKRKRNIIIITSVIAVLSLIGIFLVSRSNQAVMPDLVGMTEQTAAEQLISQGLLNSEIEYMTSDEIQQGIVIKTNPLSGSDIVIDGKITIYVSSGVGSVTVQDYTGKLYPKVQAELEAKGLIVKIEKKESNEAIDTIIDQFPNSGESVKIGSTVTLYVSSGPQELSMTNLVNLSESEASK